MTTTAPEAAIQAEKERNKVSVAREESFTYTDHNGNAYDTVYRIPSINMDSKDAEAANEEISEKYLTDFEKAERECAALTSLTCEKLDYEKFENDNVLSVVIRRVFFSHAVDYSVYNFHAVTGVELSSEGVMKSVNITPEQAQELLKKQLEQDYVSKYKTAQPEKYEENMEKTLSDDNLDQAMYYLGKDGVLRAICKEYASVGSGEFSVVLTVKSAS